MIETERLLLEPLDASRLEDFVVLTARSGHHAVLEFRVGRSRATWRSGTSRRRSARLREHGFGRRWIVAKENGAGLGFTDTKYFGNSLR